MMEETKLPHGDSFWQRKRKDFQMKSRMFIQDHMDLIWNVQCGVGGTKVD